MGYDNVYVGRQTPTHRGDMQCLLQNVCTKWHTKPSQCVNPLTPNDPYRGRTVPLTSKRCILYFYSTNIGTEYFKHGIYSPYLDLGGTR